MSSAETQEPNRSRLSVSLDGILGKEDDAFKEASYSEAEYPRKEENAVNAGTAEDELPPSHDREDDSKPGPVVEEQASSAVSEPLRFDRPEQKTKRVGGKRAGFALFLSLVSVGGLGYVGYTQYQQSLAFGAEKEDLTAMFSTVGDDLNGALAAIQSFELWRPDVDEGISRIDAVEAGQLASARKLVELEAMLNAQKSTVTGLREQLVEKEQTISELTQSLSSLADKQKQLAVVKAASKPVPTPATQQRSSRPATPSVSNTIAGATVQSVDSWGASQFALLLSSGGDWSTVRVGSSFDGWEFAGAFGNYALFTQGTRQLKVKIGG